MIHDWESSDSECDEAGSGRNSCGIPHSGGVVGGTFVVYDEANNRIVQQFANRGVVVVVDCSKESFARDGIFIK